MSKSLLAPYRVPNYIFYREKSNVQRCLRNCVNRFESDLPRNFFTSVPMRNVDLAELTDTERILNVLLKKKGRVNASRNPIHCNPVLHPYFSHSSVSRNFFFKSKSCRKFHRWQKSISIVPWKYHFYLSPMRVPVYGFISLYKTPLDSIAPIQE